MKKGDGSPFSRSLKTENRPLFYPMFADLQGRLCVVVGGGLVAQRKVTTLLSYGARITVVSPTVTRRLARYAAQRRIRYVARTFRPADLAGSCLVYGATNDERINHSVSQTAQRARIFANIVDQKPLCSFIAPAIFRRGELVVAFSTGGASPTVSKLLRRDLTATVGRDYARLVRLLGGLRGIAKRRLPSYNDRKRYFDRLVRGPVFRLVREGRTAAARHEALGVLAREAAKRHD